MSSKKTGSIWLYKHDSGYFVAEELQQALRVAQPRWDVPSYCARIIVEQILLSNQDRDPVLGWGLSLEYTDSRYNILELDMQRKRVQVRQVIRGDLQHKIVGHWIPFDDFVTMADVTEFRNTGLSYVGDKVL